MHDTKKITLPCGRITLLDLDDYEKYSPLNWHAEKKCKGLIYYVTRVKCLPHKKRRRIYLHREILNASKGVLVDHINGDTLDNRKCNLRLCTIAQNRMNCAKRGNQKYKGVHRSGKRTKESWYAMIQVNKKAIYLGVFDSEEKAATAYNKAAIKHQGSFARLNIIQEVA